MAANYARLEERLLRWTEAPESGRFEGVALDVHAFQRAANPAYGKYCAQFGPARDWKAIPALPQQLFKTEAIRCFPAEHTMRTFRTSGTTGEGYGEHHFSSLRLYRAGVEEGWRHAGLRRSDVLALIPDASEAPHSSLSQMASWLTEAGAFFVRSGEAKWEDLQQRAVLAKEPVTLFGTALAFLDWFEWLGTRRIELPAGSAAVETGGYKGTRRELPKVELLALFEARLGLGGQAVINEYGMTELSSQFYARGIGNPHRHPPWARGLVIDPETGREVADGGTGILRLVDALNLGSVCAVQTQDLAVRAGEDFILIGRDPAALPRGCSRAADEILNLNPAGEENH